MINCMFCNSMDFIPMHSGCKSLLFTYFKLNKNCSSGHQCGGRPILVFYMRGVKKAYCGPKVVCEGSSLNPFQN